MKFAQGSLIVLVGKPGDGKSTLMKLMGSQLIPDGGDLLIPPHLRVLHISQNPAFFHDTLYNNLTYGASEGPDMDLDRVIKICQMLGVAKAFFKYLDPTDVLYTTRADWDEVLSQTLRSQLSLARAFIANPEILLVHKPTLVLNDENVEKVFACLKDFVNNRGLQMDDATKVFRRPRTCVITTARPKGLLVADKVFKIEPTGVKEVSSKDMAQGLMF